MEVASPLTFTHTQAGGKRAFACSPGLMEGSASAVGMDVTEDYSHQAFKRRRFSEQMESTQQHMSSPHLTSSFATLGTHARSPFTPANGGSSFKRGRSDWNNTQGQHQFGNDLSSVVQEQAAEIESLKCDKASLESSVNALRAENEKVVHENKILKKAVTIQQERQTHAMSEIEAARRFKVDAEDRVRRLEQMILTLRYHLQTQQQNPSNDFMGFAPRNPDVF